MICAIDFGTSNSAVAVPLPAGVQLARVEAEHTLLPTAVFYDAEDKTTRFGRAALVSYVSGADGRLMRSMKSVLGSSLMDGETDIGGGRTRAYTDVLADFLRHLKTNAESLAGQPIHRAVIGRPVQFVDDDSERDDRAQSTLEAVARKVGFTQVQFQLEPMAAAYDLEQTLSAEKLVLIADFGGGTCDFSLVRLGGRHKGRPERQQDVLAHSGIHIAGTDFDRRVSLAALMPALGASSKTPQGREVPSAVYHDLSTWHLINLVYTPPRVRELVGMAGLYAQPNLHKRLMRVVHQRLGHQLAAKSEQAKVDAAERGAASIDLQAIEANLQCSLDGATFARALDHDLDRITACALACVKAGGIASTDVQLIYFTGGSSRLKLLADRVAAAFPSAQPVHGDSFASVAKGLGVYAASLMHAPSA